MTQRQTRVEMDTNLSKLLVGLSVQICRSDGRVHFASVKSVDTTKDIVMVEWYERNMCRGKEVELNELCSLNPELKDHINSAITKAATPPPSTPEITNKYETRLRSSRIPAPSTLARKTQGRQTCLFQAPVSTLAPVLSTESAQAVPPTVCPDLPPKPVLMTSGIPNQPHRKKKAQPTSVSGAIKDNKDENFPLMRAATGRRISGIPQEQLNKTNKRISSIVKPSDEQPKKGKFGEASRPNQKFYQMIEDFRETLEIAPLSATDLVENLKICVCVRKRPLNRQEINRKEIDVISVPGKGILLVHEPKQKVDLTKYLENQVFQFDYSFDETTPNDMVYWFTAKPLVRCIFEGCMATCFAYGQTGSGKTHTMGGDFMGKQQNSTNGIYALAAQDVFSLLGHRRFASLNLSTHVSFFEIYNGKVYDLLNKKAKLRVLEDERQQVQVVGLEEVYVSSAEEVFKLIEAGSGCRTSGQTSANANSSRSHAVLQIILRCKDRARTLHGKFSLVDLAGNERGTDVSSNDRSTLVETAEINRSLLALKECIRSLGKNSDHIPFRMSTLTKVLRDSFIGEKSRTCMIAMVSPGMASCDYTMNTLRYADRVKELNSMSRANGEAKAQERTDSSLEEDTSVCSDVYEAISQVAGLEEKVYEELQVGSEFMKTMEQTSYNIEEGITDLVAYAKKLLDKVLVLQTAVDQEKVARMNPSYR